MQIGILSGVLLRILWVIKSYLGPQRGVSAKDGQVLHLTASLHHGPHRDSLGKAGTTTKPSSICSSVLTHQTSLSQMKNGLTQCFRGHVWQRQAWKLCPVVLFFGTVDYPWKERQIKAQLAEWTDCCNSSHVHWLLSEGPKASHKGQTTSTLPERKRPTIWSTAIWPKVPFALWNLWQLNNL